MTTKKRVVMALLPPRIKGRARVPKVESWRKWPKERIGEAKLAGVLSRMARAKKGRIHRLP